MKNNEEVKVVFNGEEKTIICKDSKNVTIDELKQAGIPGHSIAEYCEYTPIQNYHNAIAVFKNEIFKTMKPLLDWLNKKLSK